MSVIQQPKQKHVNNMVSILKIILLFIVLTACLESITLLFQWKDIEQLPQFLRIYAPFLLSASPYLRYFNALIVIVLGYFIVGEVGNVVYAYMRGFSDHSSAETIRNITRIVGFGVLLAILASIFSLDPSAALTLGSFGGLIVGFATQTFISNVIAGIFVLITRPFTFGDIVTIAGNTGTVKEIRIMHIVIESIDASKDIMIPNSLVLSQVVLKNRPGMRMGPIPTTITLNVPPEKVVVGTIISLTGQLTETLSGKPLAQASVILFDRDIGRDDLLIESSTDAEGHYQIEWKVRKVDAFDDTAELYVKFEGDDEHKAVNTKQFVIEVAE